MSGQSLIDPLFDLLDHHPSSVGLLELLDDSGSARLRVPEPRFRLVLRLDMVALWAVVCEPDAVWS